MSPTQLLAYFDRIAEAPGAVPRLRRFILDLAVRGKLVEQDPGDEPANQLIARIERQRKSSKATPLRRLMPSTLSVDEAFDLLLPPGWAHTALAQLLIELQTGPFGSSLHKSDYRIGGTPVINPASIKEDRLVPLGNMAVGPETVERLAPFKLHSGDIVMARRGDLGRCAVVTERETGWLCGTGSLILRLADDVHARFIVLLLGSPFGRGYLGQSAVGATMQNLNQSILLSFPVALPPRPEQQRIVAQVDELMALCDRLEAAQAERERRRRSFTCAAHRVLRNDLQRTSTATLPSVELEPLTRQAEQISPLRLTILRLAIQGRLGTADNADQPAHVLLGHRMLRLEAGDRSSHLPEGWAWSSLERIGESMGGGTPSKSNHEFWSGSIPWVSPKDMKIDRIQDAEDHITEQAIENSAARLIPAGALLMVVRGMILAHSFPTAINSVPVTINQDMKAVLPFREEMTDFLLLVTKAMKPEVLQRVKRSTHGTCKLLTNELFSLPIPIPPLVEQGRILAKVNELMALCDHLEAQLVTVVTERKRLLEAVLRNVVDSSHQSSNRQVEPMVQA